MLWRVSGTVAALQNSGDDLRMALARAHSDGASDSRATGACGSEAAQQLIARTQHRSAGSRLG
jgi:hypothetical protein